MASEQEGPKAPKVRVSWVFRPPSLKVAGQAAGSSQENFQAELEQQRANTSSRQLLSCMKLEYVGHAISVRKRGLFAPAGVTLQSRTGCCKKGVQDDNLSVRYMTPKARPVLPGTHSVRMQMDGTSKGAGWFPSRLDWGTGREDKD
eukprot:929359-Pelagomonas_calceolata.AAC.2